MKYKSIYFTASDYNFQKSSSLIPKSSKYNYNGYNISGELYYYPDLDNLIQALKSGKDISARINYTMLSDSDYVGPIYNSGGSDVQLANVDTVASIQQGSSTDFSGDVVEPVATGTVYYRNGMTFYILDSVIASMGDNDEFTYSDLPAVMEILGSTGGLKKEAVDDSEIENYFHTLVGVNVYDSKYNDTVTLWLTDEPAENFKSVYVMMKEKDEEESGGQSK